MPPPKLSLFRYPKIRRRTALYPLDLRYPLSPLVTSKAVVSEASEWKSPLELGGDEVVGLGEGSYKLKHLLV